jgi:tetratricopeptide (TPR) repeat protein
MARRRSGSDWDDRDDRRGRGDSRGGRGDYADEPEVLDDADAMFEEVQALQQEGRMDEAIELCEELVATFGRPDARYYLAWMFQEEHVWDGAIEHFTALLDDPDYALSCYYALGQCYRSKGDLKTAVSYFDEAVDKVNLDALERAEADHLIQLCNEAARTHDDIGDAEGAQSIFDALIGFLRSRGWNDFVAQVERLLAERQPSGPALGNRSMPGASPAAPQASSPASSMGSRSNAGFLNEPARPVTPLAVPQMPAVPVAPVQNFGAMPQMPPATSFPPGGGLGMLNRLGAAPPPLPEPQRTQVMHAMREVESYVSHGLYTAAIEECLRIIEVAPQYLDVHQALAEIYVQQGKIDQAITKYAILIDTFLVSGRIDDAITAYRRILQLEPNNLTYHVKLINLLAQHGRTDEMLRERVAAAEAYLRLGYPDRAIEQFEQALVAAPGNVGLRQNYALALIRAGRVNQGIVELQRILQTEPNNVLALARWQIALCTGAGVLSGTGGLANSNIRMLLPGDGTPRVASVELLSRLARTMHAESLRGFDEVLREYVTAIESSPTNGDLRYALGVVYHVAGRAPDALSAYQTAAATPGLEVLGKVGAALVLMMMSDPTSSTMAVNMLEEARAFVRQSPPSLALWSARPRLDGEVPGAPDIEIAQLLDHAYKRSSPNAAPMMGFNSGPGVSVAPAVPYARTSSAFADEIYRTINEITLRHPNDMADALQEMVQLVKHYRGQKHYEQAVIVLNEIARLAPDDPSVHAELAEIHIARGLLDEGMEELRRVVEIYMRHNQVSEASQTLQQIGETQWQMGQQQESLATLKQVLGLTPDDMGTRTLYVEYCLELGMRQEAAEQQTVLARYYFHSRQTKEAVAALQQLIALDSNNFEAYDLLGQTYYSVGEYDQALRVYRHLAKLNPNSPIARERLNQINEMRAHR